MMATTSFGRDTSCTDGLKAGRYVKGLRLVAEACYRRLTTPRGTLRYDLNYGFDLAQFIGAANSRALEVSLPGRIRNELLKDERVEAVEAEVLVTTDGPATTFEITISVDTAEGPFSFQVGIGAVTVELLGISEDA
jgi:phage baseplate assembly protein W